MGIRSKLEDVLRNELDDCERALRNGDMEKARRELDDAVSKLKDLLSPIGRLERLDR